MTGPTDPRPEIVQRHDEQAQRAEDAAVAVVVGPVRAALTAVFRWLAGLWARLFGRPRTVAEGDRLAGLLDELAGRLLGVELPAEEALLAHARAAREMGVRQGYTEVGVPVPSTVDTAVSEETQALIRDGLAAARDRLETGAERVRGMESGSLLAVLRESAAAQQAASVLERTARTAWNSELNAGIEQAADEIPGAELVWVAERDACVHCLALSGVIRRHRAFDWRRTFGAKAYPPRNSDGEIVPLLRPPRHPRCRCRISIWLGHDEAGARAITHDWAEAIREAEAKGDTTAANAARRAAAAAAQSAAFDLPAALRREAERSVLNGYALPSESERVRVDAAERLLQQIGDGKGARAPSGWRVPASVKKKAQQAVGRGEFPTGPVPTRR